MLARASSSSGQAFDYVQNASAGPSTRPRRAAFLSDARSGRELGTAEWRAAPTADDPIGISVRLGVVGPSRQVVNPLAATLTSGASHGDLRMRAKRDSTPGDRRQRLPAGANSHIARVFDGFVDGIWAWVYQR